MSRKISALSATQPAAEPAVYRTVFRASCKGSCSSASRRELAQPPARTVSQSSDKPGNPALGEKEVTASHTLSRSPSVSKQSQIENPQYWGMPVITYEPLPQDVVLDSIPLPGASVPKISMARHRAHVAKKYSSTKWYNGIYGVKSGLQALKGTPSVKIIHARVYLFYARTLWPSEYIVDLADAKKNLSSYGVFQGEFMRLFKSHFAISDGRARVLCKEKRMPEPWMEVHIDVAVEKETRNGKEEIRESALGLYKPIVLNSSKMEEMKRNGGKCGPWIEEAKKNEDRERKDEEERQKWSDGKRRWRLPHRSRQQG